MQKLMVVVYILKSSTLHSYHTHKRWKRDVIGHSILCMYVMYVFVWVFGCCACVKVWKMYMWVSVWVCDLCFHIYFIISWTNSSLCFLPTPEFTVNHHNNSLKAVFAIVNSHFSDVTPLSVTTYTHSHTHTQIGEQTEWRRHMSRDRTTRTHPWTI